MGLFRLSLRSALYSPLSHLYYLLFILYPLLSTLAFDILGFMFLHLV